MKHCAADAAALSSPYVPIGHFTQATDDVLPVKLLYVPGGQSLHAAAFCDGPNLPAEQLTHKYDMPSTNVPSGHGLHDVD